jgi:hypothetical protein
MARPLPASRLRDDLQRITSEFVGNKVARQIPAIANLSVTYPHSITIEATAIPGKPETFHFTCFQYALGIVGSKEIECAAQACSHWNAFPGNRFVTWLAETKLKERSGASFHDNDLLIYFSGNTAHHAGIWRNGFVLSKWGTCHTWVHGVNEVPSEYGDSVCVYLPPAPSKVESWFRQYLHTL